MTEQAETETVPVFDGQSMKWTGRKWMLVRPAYSVEAVRLDSDWAQPEWVARVYHRGSVPGFYGLVDGGGDTAQAALDQLLARWLWLRRQPLEVES